MSARRTVVNDELNNFLLNYLHVDDVQGFKERFFSYVANNVDKVQKEHTAKLMRMNAQANKPVNNFKNKLTNVRCKLRELEYDVDYYAKRCAAQERFIQRLKQQNKELKDGKQEGMEAANS